MYEDLAKRQLYISETGIVECRETKCKCDDGFIAFPGSRVTVEEFLKALKDHWAGLE